MVTKLRGFPARLPRFAQRLVIRFKRAPMTTQAIFWAAAAGFTFSVLNMFLRLISQSMHPFQTQFLRYLLGFVVMIPLMARVGFAHYRPSDIKGQFSRGLVHSMGLTCWFYALPHLALADMTAIGYTGPIFSMLGAAWLLGEKMRLDRWVAAIIGFTGVLVVVGPRLAGSGGWYSLIMLASAPLFSMSFLLTKMLTRHDSPQVIVAWQAIAVSIITLPMAIWVWQAPTPMQWFLLVITGILGSAGHFFLTHSLKAADVSATQSVKFLDLVWATGWGFLVFGDHPSGTTLIGGVIIVAATLWIARRESRMARQAAASKAAGSS
jgi:drug/metabolite transporter (DMT)-like permease